MRANRDTLAAILAAAAVILVVVLGFWKVHGPSAQRLVRADERRLQNLSQLANEINAAYRQHDKQLPAELTELQKKRFADPITGKPPQYSAKSASVYSLCATFTVEGPKEDYSGNVSFWSHPAGTKCFELDAAEQVPPAPYFYY
jgi:hypothetical protein